MSLKLEGSIPRKLQKVKIAVGHLPIPIVQLYESSGHGTIGSFREVKGDGEIWATLR